MSGKSKYDKHAYVLDSMMKYRLVVEFIARDEHWSYSLLTELLGAG